MFNLNYGKQTVLNHVLSMYMYVLKPPKNLQEKFLTLLSGLEATLSLS